MSKSKSSARSSKAVLASESRNTVQRTYRFNASLFSAFEDDCATHLANPKRVIEALILHWLDAGRDERASMAHKHRERTATSFGVTFFGFDGGVGW